MKYIFFFYISCINISKPTSYLSRYLKTRIHYYASFISQPPQFLIYRMEILRGVGG